MNESPILQPEAGGSGEPPMSSFRRTTMFIGGAGMASVLTVVGGAVGCLAAWPGMVAGGLGAPILWILFARSSGNRPLAVGAIVGFALTAAPLLIVFGACYGTMTGR